MSTDTDSLTSELKANDAFEDLYRNKCKFDFSEYSENSKFYVNKNAIGKMDEESKSVLTVDFVRLKSKMYWFITEDDRGDKKTKRNNQNTLLKKGKSDMKSKGYKINLIN